MDEHLWTISLNKDEIGWLDALLTVVKRTTDVADAAELQSILDKVHAELGKPIVVELKLRPDWKDRIRSVK